MLRASMAALLAFPVFADELPSPLPEVAAEPVPDDHYPPHDVTFPKRVRGAPDLAYSAPTGYRPLTLDLYLPPETARKPARGFPLIVYIHGGGWLAGDSRRHEPFVDFPGVLASLSARGYVVASLNYRLSGEARFPAPIQDVKAAIRRLRARAPEYGIDPARAMTWGMSAGGHLAALAAVSCNAAALEPPQASEADAPDLSDCVQGAVAWYGVFDLATIAAQARRDQGLSRDVRDAPEWRLIGCFATECSEGQIAAASPITYVDPKDPPMLLIAGSEDKIVPHRQTLDMAARLAAAGVPHELVVIPGVDHLLIGKAPEETRGANLRALAATFAFIDRTMAAAGER
jgi:acetyl esterase/lipase